MGNNVKFPLFRKGLSTSVETALELTVKSPVSNYFNNTKSIIHTYQNKEQFYLEGVQAVNTGGEVELMKAEMIKWYSEDSKIKYEKQLVIDTVEYITGIVIFALIKTGVHVDNVKAYNKRQSPKQP